MSDDSLMPMADVRHPLPLGTRVMSVNGEMDEGAMSWDESDTMVIRRTGPRAVGVVEGMEYSEESACWIYSVVFMPWETWVFLDETDFHLNPEAYYVVELGDGQEPNITYSNSIFRDPDVMRQIAQGSGEHNIEPGRPDLRLVED